MTFPVVAIDNVRSFSRTRSSARRPLRLIEPVRGYQPPISHANFESWLGGFHRIPDGFEDLYIVIGLKETLP